MRSSSANTWEVAGRGVTSCNRVESAVSDQDGWFNLPIDPGDGGPLMEAYHRGYGWGLSTRRAWAGVDGNINHWQVTVYKRSEDNLSSVILRTEPTIYHSQAEALAASRQELDVYLKSFKGTREERLRELHRLTNAGSCNGPHRTTAGPVPFFEAIYAEQIELNDNARFQEMLRDSIAAADSQFVRAKAGK